MRISFVKCHGSGNDFALIDARGLALGEGAWAAVARALSNRQGPVGSDGILLLNDDDRAAFAMRMFNPDGTEAETCLNGLRCVARAGLEAKGGARATVALKNSMAEVALDTAIAPGVRTIRERVGPAGLDAGAWPIIGRSRVVEQVLPELDTARAFTAIAIPNPHLISFVDRVDDDELVALGMQCEAAPPWLPNRANVSFVEQRGGDLFVRTHERGVGLTNACGSAMAAASYAACLTGRLAFSVPLTVFNAGGLVRAVADVDGMVTLSGNATFEWRGSAEVDLEAGVARDLTVEERFADENTAWARALADLSPDR